MQQGVLLLRRRLMVNRAWPMMSAHRATVTRPRTHARLTRRAARALTHVPANSSATTAAVRLMQQGVLLLRRSLMVNRAWPMMSAHRATVTRPRALTQHA